MERQTRLEDAAAAALGPVKEDPGCIEAHLFLARHARDTHLAYAHLSTAVATGQALWKPVAAAQHDFAWWGVTATRPCMHAIKELALWHAGAGDDLAAQRLFGFKRPGSPPSAHSPQ